MADRQWLLQRVDGSVRYQDLLLAIQLEVKKKPFYEKWRLSKFSCSEAVKSLPQFVPVIVYGVVITHECLIPVCLWFHNVVGFNFLRNPTTKIFGRVWLCNLNSSACVSCNLHLICLLKEAKLYYIQNRREDCLATCRDVCDRANRLNSGNWPFLLTRALYITSAVHRQAKEFDKANEYMEKSSEVLNY